jgi:hypothetical protein
MYTQIDKCSYIMGRYDILPPRVNGLTRYLSVNFPQHTTNGTILRQSHTPTDSTLNNQFINNNLNDYDFQSP